MWTRGLAYWYRRHGRHNLTWRHTDDPWAILVSEVMLQQTQVGRVVGRWDSFLERWPTPHSCANAGLADVLREWRGLGYPRRARDLHQVAATVAEGGWPQDEAGLRALPGVGPYTARALLTLALRRPSPPPRDVNVSRVAARAALGVEPGVSSATSLDEAVQAGRPSRMSRRDYTYALFDVGALHCRSRPRCDGCPLRPGCASLARLAGTGAPVPERRQPRYHGSNRELRGAVLRLLLGPAPPSRMAELNARLAGFAAARHPGGVEMAVAGLVADRLIPAGALAD